jgi:predicted nucleotidyltransferase
MTRDFALSILRAHADELRAMGVARLFLFGSVVRDAANMDSDVDLFFDFDDPDFSLIELLTVKNRLGDLLDTPADVMTRGSLHPMLKQRIEQSAVRVF